MECLSQLECDNTTTCVAGRCVGAELQGDPFEIYTQEIHARLVSECGVCHAAAEESEPAPEGDIAKDAMRSFESDNPFGLTTYTTRLGDSGWRIYINNLTPDRLRAFYEDTLQYLNLQVPEQSLLFAYGRGDVGVSANLQHPKLYPSGEELDQVDVESIIDTNYIGYQRLVSWASLTHLSPVAMTYDPNDLSTYQSRLQDAFNGSCLGCHNGAPTNTTEGRALGGFAFFEAPVAPSDLAALNALIDLERPEESALIRLIYGELDHIDLSMADTEEYETAALEWIERFR
jgi:hypothetical protein